MSNVWKGVLIQESLDNSSLPLSIKIVGTKTTTLEKEENGSVLHFHNLEVVGENLNEVIKFISDNILDRWYFHLVKDGEIIVIFRNKILKARKEEAEKIEEIRKYGLSQGILKEQMGLERLIDNPYD